MNRIRLAPCYESGWFTTAMTDENKSPEDLTEKKPGDESGTTQADKGVPSQASSEKPAPPKAAPTAPPKAAGERPAAPPKKGPSLTVEIGSDALIDKIKQRFGESITEA